MTERAHVLEKRHKKQCSICMLLDTDNREMKWHTYEEGFTEYEDTYICNNCLETIKDVRKRCHRKVDNPTHDAFKNFIPWFIKDIPGAENGFNLKEN